MRDGEESKLKGSNFFNYGSIYKKLDNSAVDVNPEVLESGAGLVPRKISNQLPAMQFNSNVEAKSKLSFAGDIAMFSMIMVLSWFANYSSRRFGEMGFEYFTDNRDIIETGGEGALTSNMTLNAIALLFVFYGIAAAIKGCLKDPHQRRPQAIAKQTVRAAVLLPLVVPAANVSATGNDQAVYKEALRAFYDNATYYSSLFVNYFFPAQLFNKAENAIQTLRKPKITVQHAVLKTFEIVELEIETIIRKNPQMFIETFARYKESNTQERFNIIADLAQTVLKKLENEGKLRAFLRNESQKGSSRAVSGLKLSFKALIAIICVVGVVMTYAKIGLSIPSEIFDIIKPTFLALLVQKIPNLWSAISSATVNGIENFITALDLLPTAMEIFKPSNWLHLISTGFDQVALYCVFGFIGVVSSLLNGMTMLGMALRNPLYKEVGLDDIQGLSSGVGSTVLGGYGFMGTFKFVQQKVKRTLWGNVVRMDEQKFIDYYQNQKGKYQVRMLDFTSGEFINSLQALKEDLKSRDADVAEHLALMYEKELEKKESKEILEENLTDAASMAPLLRTTGHFKFNDLVNIAQEEGPVLTQVAVEDQQGKLYSGRPNDSASESGSSVSEQSLHTVNNDDKTPQVGLNQ